MNARERFLETMRGGRPDRVPYFEEGLRDDVLDEKATSAIIEGKCKLEKLPDALRALQEAAKKVNTVFTVEVITKVTPDGEIPIKPVLEDMGIWYSLNSKNNVGIGEPSFNFYPDQN